MNEEEVDIGRRAAEVSKRK